MLRDLLRGEGVEIGRQRVGTMMKRMGITALYRRPNTSKPAPGHKIYPYLLRSVTVERPNQVWAMDITYIPMARGFVYLAAVVDWFSRRVLAWRLSITMEVEFCLEAVVGGAGEARQAGDFQHGPRQPVHQRRLHGPPSGEGHRHQHGRQGIVAGQRFRRAALALGQIREVYLRAYESVGEARASIRRYLDFYNRKRPHSSLDARTPDHAYFHNLPQVAAA
jgi:putative transposase